MTSYAPNWTPRFKAEYSTFGMHHSITLRTARGTNAAGVIALGVVAHDFFNALAADLTTDFAWVAASYALTDSDFFIPTATPTAVTGASATGFFSLYQKISPFTFTGRSASGRARVSAYGVAAGTGGVTGIATDFKVLASESTLFADAIAVLQAGAIGNAGEATTWHLQATTKSNDRLVKKVRQGLV